MKYTGRDFRVGIGKEVDRGTPIAAQYWIPRRTFDVEDKVLTIIDDQGYGVIEDSTDVRAVGKWAEGSIGGVVRDKAIGLLLLNALGTPEAVSVGTGTNTSTPYTHTFIIYQSHQHPSLTIEVDDPVEGDVAFPLVMLNSLEIVAELGEFVLFTGNFMSLKSVATPVTAAYVAENEFAADDVTVKIAEEASGLDAASTTKVKSASITIEKELEKDDVLGSVDPDDFLNKTVRVIVSITKNYEDTVFKDNFTSASPMAMRINIEDTSVTIGDASTPRIRFNLNKVVITEWTADRGLDGIVTETFTAKANFKIADSKMIEAVVVNEVESY